MAKIEAKITKSEKTNQKIFYNLLGNTLLASVVNYTVWFAITFYMYLQTQSVFATSLVAGIYLIATAASGFWFGSLVDHNKKKRVMTWSSLISLAAYIIAFATYLLVPAEAFKDIANPILWMFVLTLMAGVIVGNVRNIAQSTLVTLLIPEDRRAKANGLVGTAGGIGFLLTSVISGILVAVGGMFWVLAAAIVFTIAALVHLSSLAIPEKGILHINGEPKVDIKGTFKVVAAIPGLLALIFFTTFNNFLGGVYMSLMDAYGLSLVPVEVWGLIWGVLSTGFIIGGVLIAKFGLGKNPLRTMFLANIIIWAISSLFTIQESMPLLLIGMYAYMAIMPYIEASEQTILQKVVPHERQGRVFGFAQSIEMTAAPLTAFLIGPLAQFVFIPFMTNGAGAQLIGGWFGTGSARGIALVFTLTGIIGLVVTLLAMASKYYKQLSAAYLADKPTA